MESSRSKRRRLVRFYIPPRPDLPAIFESLNDDTLTTVLEFVGNKCYKSFGGLNKHCKEIYLLSGMTKETFLYGYAPLSVIINKIERAIEDNDWDLELFEAVGKGVVFYNRRDVMDWLLQNQHKYVLKRICKVAAMEDRLDILEEVWNNDVTDDDDKREIFGDVDSSAAEGGKLNVLKWVDTKGLPIKDYWCAHQAARYGQLHILKWLQEERGLELKRELYGWAVVGNQLNVMKWLREQEVDWDEYTFMVAAEEGNLEILQWLHDEDCPWLDDYCVDEEDLDPEVIDWCRVNGYANRVYRDL